MDVNNNGIPATAETPATTRYLIQQESQPQQGVNQLQGLQVSLTTAANLPTGSLIPVANNLFIRWWQK
jgi:hypothetical protein